MVRIIFVILNKIVNNEQLVSKLAESYPMRRAAQLLVYLYNKNKHHALEFKNSAQLEEKIKKIYDELQKKIK